MLSSIWGHLGPDIRPLLKLADIVAMEPAMPAVAMEPAMPALGEVWFLDVRCGEY